jgi:hypothetical protein
MQKLHNNIASNQTAVKRLRFKLETGLGNTNGCYIHNKQNAPNR